MAKQANVISHWHRLIENFQASSQAFYASVEDGIEHRKVPEQHSARIEHKEGALASANREYLRLHRGKHAFDICAAPFGTGFFISWWFTEPPLAFAILYTIAFLCAVLVAMGLAFTLGFSLGASMVGASFGFFSGWLFAFLGVPVILWWIGNCIRQGIMTGESTVLAMPLIGRIYERIFAPTTFYSLGACPRNATGRA